MKKIVVDPDVWDVIVRFLYEMPITMANAKRAVEVQEAIDTAEMMDITKTENE